MDKLVSKERTKKTKERQKNIGLNKVSHGKFLDRPVMGAIIAGLAWLISIFGWRAKSLILGEATAETMLPLISDAIFALVGIFCVALYLKIVYPNYLKR